MYGIEYQRGMLNLVNGCNFMFQLVD